MSNKGTRDKRLRTPQSKVNHWRRTEAAFLSDEFSRVIGYKVQTEAPDTQTSLELVKLLAAQGSQSDRFSFDWLLEHVDSNHPNLHRLGGEIIHIASMPTPRQHKFNIDDRPYTDVLFLGGEVNVKLANSGSAEDSFNIGRVVGLAIVTRTADLPVWPAA